MQAKNIDSEKRIEILSRVLDPEHRDVVNKVLQASNGDLATASETLKDKLPNEALQKLHVADLVATAIGDKPEVTGALLADPDINTTRDIANLNADELTKRLAFVVPSDSVAREHAQAINRQSFVREPLTVLQRMTREGDIPLKGDDIRTSLNSFLQNIHPDTNVRTTPIHKVLTEDALKDVPPEHRSEVIDQAKALWRTVAVTPHDAPHVPSILMKSNRTSAFLVGEMPESTFTAAYADSMGKETAQQVYTNAINTRLRNEHTLISMRETILGTGLAVIDGTQTREHRVALAKEILAKNDHPLNLDILFNDMDYCECDECRSVYSASSYFVELLNFLRNNNLGPDPAAGNPDPVYQKGILGTPLEILFSRRPDLGDLELTCQNTNTVLPYIDLVNEVMEIYIVHHALHNAIAKTAHFIYVQRGKGDGHALDDWLQAEKEVVHTTIENIAYDIYESRGRTEGHALDDWLKAEKIVVESRAGHEVHDFAYNVTDETSNELLGQPQHTNYLTYFILKNEAVYPFTLPFHQPVEVARVFLKYLGTSRWQLLDAFRAAHESTGLFDVGIPTPRGLGGREIEPLPLIGEAKELRQSPALPSVYECNGTDGQPAWGVTVVQDLHKTVLDRAVDAEFLGMTQEEYIVITGEAFWKKEFFKLSDCEYQQWIGLKDPWGYFGYDSKQEMLWNLPHVKEHFLPRTGLQYAELVDLLKTRFVNPSYPHGQLLDYLKSNRFNYSKLQTLIVFGGTNLITKYAPLVAHLGFHHLPLGVTPNYSSFGALNRLIVLHSDDEQDSCSLDNVRLLHFDGSELDETEVGKMNRFIRLWRKLGWTIEEVDQALQGLGGTQPEINPDLIHQLVAVKKLVDRTALPLSKLLVFWGNIGASGEKSLYARLFLSHNMLGIDDIFKANANGDFLTFNAMIVEHVPILMAALNLKSDDITSIFPNGNEMLTLENVSRLYRCGLLAKLLHIKVSDLSDVETLFDNPFASADATLEFLDGWQKMENAGFTFRQLAYLVLGHDDPLKPLAPSQKTILLVGKTLYDGLIAIDRDHPEVAVEDASTELVRTKSALLFEPQEVEQILGLLDGTTVYSTNAPADLDINVPETIAAKVRYTNRIDVSPHQAALQVTGILTAQELSLAINLSSDVEWKNAFAKRIQKQTNNVFNNAIADIIPPEKVDEERTYFTDGDVSAADKRFRFMTYFLPLLKRELRHRCIVETISAPLGLTREVTETLVVNVVKGQDASQSAEEVLSAVKDMPLGATPSWYLSPPEDGTYSFSAFSLSRTPSGAYVKPDIINIDGKELQFKQQEDPSNLWYTSPPLTLKKGQLYKLHVTDRSAENLQWNKAGMSWAPIPTSALLPDHFGDAHAVGAAREVINKLYKAAILVSGVSLGSREILYLQTQGPGYFDGFDFNAISLKALLRVADYVELRKSLPKAAVPLLDLFEWAQKPDKPADLCSRINDTTQWGIARIKALLADNHLDLNSPGAFRDERNLITMQKAIALADKVAVDIDRLFKWALTGSKFWHCHGIAQDIRMTVRARFSAEDWEQAVKPLSDQLREKQKQALISYLLVQPELRDWGVVDADSLFEYFLIDVQMGTERQTSRMVQAIASVQLFIRRCLMGLDDRKDGSGKQLGVSCASVDRARWEKWMQRYRVWEANRKVFLYPENWVDPALRDDKSSFYRELESELLQKDINPTTIDETLRSYLYKVDEVADLQVVGLFLDEEGRKLHVFARKIAAPFPMYYRYLDTNGYYWFPWEKMQVDVPYYDVETQDGKIKNSSSGTCLIPVVWNNRLFVFFPQFAKKTVPAQNNKSMATMANSNQSEFQPTQLWEIKMGWSEYRDGKWTQKQVSADAVYEVALSVKDGVETVGPEIDSFRFVPSLRDCDIRIEVYCPESQTRQIPQELSTYSLVDAELCIKNHNGKVRESVFFAKVFDKNGNEIAKIDGAGWQIPYNDETVVTIPFNLIEAASRDDCIGFEVAIQQHPDVEDTWEFEAKVTLTFKDSSRGNESKLTATQYVKLLNNDDATNCATFQSYDS